MAYFILKKAGKDEFMFNLHADNGKVIATSQRYDSKQGAKNGIRSVKENAPEAEVRDDT